MSAKANKLMCQFKGLIGTDTPAYPRPEGVGGVASAALVKLLAAAVRNHVLVQGCVPVVVAHHPTASPLANRRTNRTMLEQNQGI